MPQGLDERPAGHKYNSGHVQGEQFDFESESSFYGVEIPSFVYSNYA